MNRRPAAGLAVAPLIALGLTVLVGSPTGLASAGVPAPAPTHLPPDPCDGGVGAQRLCATVDSLKDALLCEAGASVDATPTPSPVGIDWHYTFSSGHSCPVSSGDFVRMSGVLLGDFNGYRVNQSICSGMGSCGNTFSGIAAGGPAFAAMALTATQSYDTPAASTVDPPHWFLYP